MAKTAEEILRKHEPVLFDKDLGVQDMVTVICAVNEFAAQEVEAYKHRIKNEIGQLTVGIDASAQDHWNNGWMKGLYDAIKLIDTVK